MENKPRDGDTESPLLDHELVPIEEFHEKLFAIMHVPKKELDERLEAERQTNADKPKRGPKKKQP